MYLISVVAMVAAGSGLLAFTMIAIGEIKDRNSAYSRTPRTDWLDRVIIGAGAVGSLACFITALSAVIHPFMHF